MIFEKEKMRYLFYAVYALCLKLRILLNDKTKQPLAKVNEIFGLMTKELNLFLDKEFILATQLFIGKGDEQSIARGILKPDSPLEVKELVNFAMDIFQYRMVCFIVEWMNGLLKIPAKIVFVTGDKALQKYIEKIQPTGIVCSQNTIAPFDESHVEIHKRFQQEWEKYYNEKLVPELKKTSYFESYE